MRPVPMLKWAVAIALAACAGDEPGPEVRQTGSDRVGGQVVATVDGVGITVGEVRAEASRSGVSAREALDALVREELLAAEASRRGAASERQIRRATEQAAVRRLLEELVEREIDERDVTDEELRAAWEADTSFHQGEKRTVTHALFQLPEDATREADATSERLAAEAIRALRSATDLEAEVARLRTLGRADGLEVVVEDIPDIGREAPLEAPFLEAVFRAPRIGLVDRPVRTSYGWHAIVVRAIVPELQASLADVEDALRRRLVIAKRAERLESLVLDLSRETRVVRDDAVVSRELARELALP